MKVRDIFSKKEKEKINTKLSLDQFRSLAK